MQGKSRLAAGMVLALFSTTPEGVIHLLSDVVRVDTGTKSSFLPISGQHSTKSAV